jgi:predicted nucleic acid-binding protein
MVGYAELNSACRTTADSTKKPLLLSLTEADFRISQGIIQEALRLSGEN